MFEIIPNWHPLFVHFTIALLSMSSIFFVALKIFNNHSFREQLEIMAYWNLWLGSGFAIVTAIAGWFAYNSVAHDTPSHEVMTDHRNWALITLSVYVLISLWTIKQYKKIKEISMIFTFVMVMALVLLASTGWRGSEAVYRYGLGVMSLPQSTGNGHAHEHADGEGHGNSGAKHELLLDAADPHDATDGHHDKKKNEHDHSTHAH